MKKTKKIRKTLRTLWRITNVTFGAAVALELYAVIAYNDSFTTTGKKFIQLSEAAPVLYTFIITLIIVALVSFGMVWYLTTMSSKKEIKER